MIEKEFTCVVCPNGCSIKAEYAEEKPHKLVSVSGNRCPRGETWVKQEIEAPMRTFSSSVLVRNGDFIEASVRITDPSPLVKIFDVMAEIRKITAEAPLQIGQVLMENPAGTKTKVIVTRNVAKIQ